MDYKYFIDAKGFLAAELHDIDYFVVRGVEAMQDEDSESVIHLVFTE